MIFYQFTVKLLESIDLIVKYHLKEIEINIKWSPIKEFTKWTISYLDEDCTLPSHAPLYYLCSSSSKSHSLNPSFYSYWFSFDSSFYQRLFSHLITDDEHFNVLLSLPDGRILILPEAAKDCHPTIWYRSSCPSPVHILGLYYDLNNNLLDAVLSSSTNGNFPKLICNHLILCEDIGSLILINSGSLRRVLLDRSIKSPCLHLNHFLYLTSNEIRSIAISNLLKPVNENLIDQTKTLRFGQFDKLVVDGQEIILHYQNKTCERLSNLLPHSTSPSRITSLANQSKKLACLTTAITNLQTEACLLQRLSNKIDWFYQLNVHHCLKSIHQQWKLILTDQQLRVFRPTDFLLVLICQFSSKKLQIYQLHPSNQWLFKCQELISMTCICQPILILRYRNETHCQIGLKKLLLPLEESVIEAEEEEEERDYLTKKLQPMVTLALTIRNDSALAFKKLNINLARKLFIGVNIECKQQEMKVDTDVGLVDSLTIQILLSSSSVRRLIMTFSTLIELISENKKIEDKCLIKQTDMNKLIELIEETQANQWAHPSEELLMNLLQIRVYLFMFRLGSNYTVQVY